MFAATFILERGKETLEKFGERARRLIDDPEKVYEILREAGRKAEGLSSADLWLEYLLLMFRLIAAYIKGLYRDVSHETIILILASILYFLFPLDFLPDPIFIDDAAVLIFVATKVKNELDEFADWEAVNDPVGQETVGFC